jgi:hypothetical protein
LIVAIAVLWPLAASVPAWAAFLASGLQSFDIRVEVLIKLYRFGPNKVAFLRAVSAAVLVLIVLLTPFALLGRRRLRALGIAVLALLCTTGASLLVQKTVFNHAAYEALRVVEVPELAILAGGMRDECRDAGVDTFRGFVECVNRRFELSRERLQRAAGSSDEVFLRAVFYTYVVSGLWAWGNDLSRDPRAGNVFGNEEAGYGPPEHVGMRRFLESNIGACEDHTFLLQVLYNGNEMTNRIGAIPGHYFNEVRLGGRWIVTDATAGLVFADSWKDIHANRRASGEPVTVYVFPNRNLFPGNPYYRGDVGVMRRAAIADLAYGLPSPPVYGTAMPYPDSIAQQLDVALRTENFPAHVQAGQH